MARRKSMFRKVVILGVLVLAVVGGYSLYAKYSDDVVEGGEKVMERAKRVKKALEG